MVAALARPRVFVPLTAGLLLFIAGLLFLKAPLEIPSLRIEPLFQVAGYPVRNSVIGAWLAMLLLIGLSYLATRNMQLVPRGLQNLVEAVVEGFLGMVESAAGRKNGRRFFPLVATIFFFILVANWLGIVPGFGTIGKVVPAEEVLHEAEEQGKDPATVRLFIMTDGGTIPVGLRYELGGEKRTDYEITGAEWEEHHGELEAQSLTAGHLLGFLRPANTDINTPMALAIISAIFVEYWGFSTLGFRYLGKFFDFRRLFRGDFFMGAVDVFVGFLELISEMVRLVSFTFRLFGNTFAGEVLILLFSFLFPLLFPVLFFGFELFFGMIQAFIFAMLTLIFAMIAVAGHGEAEHSESH